MRAMLPWTGMTNLKQELDRFFGVRCHSDDFYRRLFRQASCDGSTDAVVVVGHQHTYWGGPGIFTHRDTRKAKFCTSSIDWI